MTQLTAHFTLEEFCASSTASRLGIYNRPPDDLIPTLTVTAQGMERVRNILGKPIHVDSGYRSLELNRRIGSRDTSQHVKGEAVDFVCPEFGTPLEICRLLRTVMVDLSIDQLIHEYGSWVHVSFTATPRHVALTIDQDGTREGI